MPPASSARKLTGFVQPRLFTPPLRPLSRRTSRGYELADFADLIGEPLLPWQRWLAIHALELMPGGGYRFGIILVLVARQNGKSSFGRTFTLWRMYLDGARTVLGVAQGLSLAREMWQLSLDTVRQVPDLAAELAQVRNVNGDERWQLASGSRYLIRASSREAGRGLSVDQLNIDELREWRGWAPWSALSKTTMARPDALTLCMSNAGDDGSEVLNSLRDSALAGINPRIGIFEWSGADGCELDDITAVRQANPALGHTVSLEAITTSRVTDPPAVYRTEVLCQRVEQLDSAIDAAAWDACADAAGILDLRRGRTHACFDVSPDGEHATLAVAAQLPDGRARVAIAGAWKGTDAARAELGALLDKIRPVSLSWYPSGPGAALATLLRQRPGSTEITGGRAAEVCQELADLAKAGRVVHPADALLDAQAHAAAKLPSADGWRFTRKGGGHVDAVYAAAGAVSQALAQPVQRARIRILG